MVAGPVLGLPGPPRSFVARSATADRKASRNPAHTVWCGAGSAEVTQLDGHCGAGSAGASIHRPSTLAQGAPSASRGAQADLPTYSVQTRGGLIRSAPEIASSARASCAISVHSQRRTCGKRVFLFVSQLRDGCVEILSFVLGRAGQDGNVPCLRIELEHRE